MGKSSLFNPFDNKTFKLKSTDFEDGCELFSNCKECPLSSCVKELAKGISTFKRIMVIYAMKHSNPDMSRDQLSKKTGISRRTVVRSFKGQPDSPFWDNYTPEELMSIAVDEYGMSLDNLLSTNSKWKNREEV